MSSEPLCHEISLLPGSPHVLPCDMKVVFLGQWQRPTVKVHFGCDIGDQDITQLDKMIGNKLQNDLSISTG